MQAITDVSQIEVKIRFKKWRLTWRLFTLQKVYFASVVSDSVRPHRWQPTRLPRPWDSPGKNTEVGCHFLLQWVKVKNESEVAQSGLTLSDPMEFQPTRLLRPWDFPGKSTAVGCHCLLLMCVWSEVKVAQSCLTCLWPHARLLCPWDFLGKNPGMPCYFLLQGIFLTQELNPHLLRLLHCQVDTLTLEPQEKPIFRCVCVCVCVCIASQVVLVVKEPACQCRRHKTHRFDPWVGKIPWRKA